MLFSDVPGMLICTLVSWIYLQWLYMGMFRPNSKEAQENQKVIEIEHIAKDVIQKKLGEMGPINTHQLSVAILFCFAISAYLSRAPGFVKGWGSLFPEKYTTRFLLH